MVQSRPPSPIKQTFKKLLSPSKQKPAPALCLQPEQSNWKYAESTSSNYSSSSSEGYTGWTSVERSRTPISDPNKENVQNSTPKHIVAQIMGRSTSKLNKRNTKSLAVLKSQDADLDSQFEELMNSRSIPSELRCKLRSVDASVKKHMLKNHSSLSHSPNKSPSKLFRYGSNADLGSPKKSKKYNTITPPSPTKAHPAAIFTEGKVWDMEMQSVYDVMEYFGKTKVGDIDVGMVKKLWQLLRNESMMWIEEFLRGGGFGVVVGVLKDVLSIEWRNEKDDAVLHQILLCLKALSTTEAGLHELSKSSPKLFPLLVNNLFSDKQPTEFSTRVLIPTLLLAHLTANPSSAETILSYLTDPPPEKPPHDFLLESYIPRPYKKWHAEINSICRDTFWVFLHPRNIIPISPPHDEAFPLSAKITAQVPSGFKGGVEWYATEYLTSHISLINTILAGLGPLERATVRRDMRNCGFENVIGGKLRKSSKEYYPGLHKELQRWCWVGHVDGWNVFDVARGGGGTDEMPVTEQSIKTEEEDLEFEVGEFEVPGGV